MRQGGLIRTPDKIFFQRKAIENQRKYPVRCSKCGKLTEFIVPMKQITILCQECFGGKKNE